MMTFIFLLFFPLLITCNPQEDYDYYEDEEGVQEEEEEVIFLLPVTHNDCPSAAHSCVLQHNCTTFTEEKEKLAALSSETEEYKTLFGSLQRQICNKEEQGVCCVFLGERSLTFSASYFDFSNCIFRSAVFRRAAHCCRDCHFNFRRKRCVRNSNNRRCPC